LSAERTGCVNFEPAANSPSAVTYVQHVTFGGFVRDSHLSQGFPPDKEASLDTVITRGIAAAEVASEDQQIGGLLTLS
jgi:hypothetical protein